MWLVLEVEVVVVCVCVVGSFFVSYFFGSKVLASHHLSSPE